MGRKPTIGGRSLTGKNWPLGAEQTVDPDALMSEIDDAGLKEATRLVRLQEVP